MFRSPPATHHPSRKLAGTSRLLLPFGVSLLLLCTPHPCWSRQPPRVPHSCLMLQSLCVPGGLQQARGECQWSVPPEGGRASRCLRGSGVGAPVPVSGLGDTLPAPVLAWIPGCVLGSLGFSLWPGCCFFPRPSSPASSPSALTPVQGPLACSCPTVCDPCRPTGAPAGVPSSRH